MKRVISLLLTVALLLSMLPVSALAMEDPGYFDTPEPDDEYGFFYEYDANTQGYRVTGYSGSATEITVPSSYNGSPVTVIGEYAFGYGYVYTAITTVTLPDTVVKIEDYAFSDCSDLQTVQLGKNVQTIGNSAFAYCTSLTEINLPSALTSIGERAFFYCFDLQELKIPASVTSIGPRAFEECTGVMLSVEEGNTHYQYTQNCLIELGTKTLVLCQGTYENLDGMIEVIGTGAFPSNILWASDELVIPDGVITIEEYAFDQFYVDRVVMPDTVQTIADNAFFGSYIKNINLSSSLKTIGDYAFPTMDTSAVEIPASVTSIGVGAFKNCGSLTSISVAADNQVYYSKNNCIIETATKTLIQGCATSVIPDDGSVTSIGASAFEGNYIGTELVIPGTIETVGDKAFWRSANLQTVELKNGVKSVGADAFASSVELHTVIMADSVTEVGNYAFYYCGKLQNVTLSKGLTRIGAGTFYYCDALTEIVIPDSVTIIDSSAFNACSALKTVTIGAGVTTIGPRAFGSCDALTDVYYRGDDWSAVTIGTGNECLTNATFHQVHAHTYGEWVIDTASTCTVQGSQSRTCADCGAVETEALPLRGHAYVAGICEICGAEAPPVCDHEYESAVTTAATCTASGILTYTCTGCGDSYTETIAATDHNYAAATCVAPKTCSACGVTEGEVGDHSYVNGFCVGCDCYEPAVLNGDVYEISNAGQLYWFAAHVNEGYVSANGKLMDHIVVNESVLKTDGSLNGTSFRVWTPIGDGNYDYEGIFDGNNKTVSGLYINDTTLDYVGLFGFMAYGMIQNVGVKDSYFCGKTNVGGVAGYVMNGSVVNSYNVGRISGDSYVGGVVGRFNYEGDAHIEDPGPGGVELPEEDWFAASTSTGSYTIAYCYNVGAVSGNTYVGGVVGQCNNMSSSGDASDEEEETLPTTDTGGITLPVPDFDDFSLRSSSSGGVIVNCYYLPGCVTNGNDYGTAMTADRFASGEVAYLLGDAYGQNIGVDSYPVLGGTVVYKNQVAGCNEESAIFDYSNIDEFENITHAFSYTETAPTCTESGWISGTCYYCFEGVGEEIPPLGHSYVDGVCTVCGDVSTVTIYFENNWLWSDVRIYYWYPDGAVWDWPGVPMTDTGVRTAFGVVIYSAELPADVEGFMFTGIKDDGSGNLDQSPAIMELQTGVCYYMAWDNGNAVGTYEYTPNAGGDEGDCTHDWIAATCAAPKTCSICGATEGEALNHIYADGVCTICGAEGPRTIYFANTEGWENVYVYLWDANGVYAGGWPGSLMTLTEDGYYSYEVPATVQNIIFNNGSGVQTADLIIPTDGRNLYNYTSGLWSIKDGEQEFYLIGWINGANSGCEENWENLNEYVFVDGRLTATFTESSYIYIKTGDNDNWYMANGYPGDDATSVTLYHTETYTDILYDKLYVPAGIEVTFTLVDNGDGTLTLSLTKNADTCQHLSHTVDGDCKTCGISVGHNWWSGEVTVQPGCTTEGEETYTCTTCGAVIPQTLPALGHSFVDGVCTTCGGTQLKTIYFKPWEGWMQVNPRYAAYFFASESYVWVDMTDADGDGYYECEVPTDGSIYVIICRMNPYTTENVWDNKWNQTAFWVIPSDGTNCYIANSDEWEDAGGTWIVYTPEAHTHSYTSEVTTAATCTTAGVRTFTCSCGDSYTEEIAATGHSYVRASWYGAAYCSVCGFAGNSYCYPNGGSILLETCFDCETDKAAYVTAPTCTEAGSIMTGCLCGLTLMRTIDALGHSWNNVDCTANKSCTVCGVLSDETGNHSYEAVVTAPTYLEQGYTTYTCTVCGYSYRSDYVEPLERISLSECTLTLEYTFAYYQGQPLTPSVSLTYNGLTITDAFTELKITYSGNDQVGIATVNVEGINMFEGSVQLTFEIAYEVIPEQIVNLVAIGEIGKISLSWAKSSEVDTDTYLIYRKGEGENDFTLIKRISGRETISYVDTDVSKGQTYTYYVVGEGLYGAQSPASEEVSATAQIDVTKPVVYKMSPASGSVVFGTVTLSATATDNVAVTKIAYAYSVDNGASWIAIGEGTSVSFNVSNLEGASVKVRAIAYDAEGNASEPMIVAYSLDNVGPDPVTGLSATALSSKVTLSWKDVSAQDAAYFIVQMLRGEEWVTVARNVTTLGYNATGLSAQTEYSFRVACVDTHNNVGAYSEPITVTTLGDTVAPVITTQGPAAGRYRDTLTYYATAKDECGVASMTIQISLDLLTWKDLSVVEFAASQISRQHSYQVDLSGYPEGSIYLRAIATDFSGNVSSTGDLAPYSQYIIDRTAPYAPAGISAAGQVGYISIQWLAGTESDLSTFSLYRATAEDGTYSLVASNLSTLNYFDRKVEPGVTYYYKVAVKDTCGNVSALSSVASACMQTDTIKPEILGFTEIYGAKISSMYHTITVNASDNNRLTQLVVEYCTFANPEYVRLADSVVSGNFGSVSVVLPLNQLVDGDIVYLRAYAVDAAGLISDVSSTRYTVDLTAPDVENYTASIDGGAVSLNWNGCREADLAGYKIYRSVNGGSFSLIASMTGGKDTYSYTQQITAKESGTYTYRLEAVDHVGNSKSWQQDVEYVYVYVNKAPTAAMDFPEQMSVGVEEQFSAAASRDDISIVSYLWDFGDGTTSNEARPVKLYETVGVYTVTLTVTDNEGLTGTATRKVEVKAREEFGVLNVTVLDDSHHVLPNFPVYIDLGEATQRIVYTDSTGRVSLRLVSGMHTVGTYSDGYLPAKKDVVVLGNATRSVTLTNIEQEIVTGEFEITRMTFDEIVAAGIDVYDPANLNVYSATARITYSTVSYDLKYLFNGVNILKFDVTPSPSGGGGGSGEDEPDGPGGGGSDRVFVPKVINEKTVAILDVPAQATYLKEFFDVRLHIFNHAASEFTLEQNQVTLNVPDGMTLMTNLVGGYQTSKVVNFDSLAGQQNITLAWVLRGDVAGEYDLTADYTGILSEFNTLVATQFVTREPIKVYGLEGVKFRILAADEIHNDTLYFNVEFENQRDIDVYLPKIDAHQWVTNVMDSYQAETFMLNSYIQMEDGQKLYNPVFVDEDGNVVSEELQVLAPGQKLVHEYVAYNAIDYVGVADLKEITVQCFSGLFENIEVGSFHKERYSFKDYAGKLDQILNPTSKELADAYDWIMDDDNYYYISEVEGSSKIAHVTYGLIDLLLEFDTEIFTNAKQKDVARQAILRLLADASTTDLTSDTMTVKYMNCVEEMLKSIKGSLMAKYANDAATQEDVAKAFTQLGQDMLDLAVIYRTDGSEALRAKIVEKLAGYAFGESLSLLDHMTYDAEAEIFSKSFGAAKNVVCDFMNAVEYADRDMYYYAFLKMNCNFEISERILDAIIEQEQVIKDQYKAELRGYCEDYVALRDLQTTDEPDKENSTLISALDRFPYMTYTIKNEILENEELTVDEIYEKLVGLVSDTVVGSVAKDLKKQLNSNKEEYYNEMALIAGYMVQNTIHTQLKEATKKLLQKAIGSTALTVVTVVFKAADTLFGFGTVVEQERALQVYADLTRDMIISFKDSIKSDDEDADMYSMIFLRAICEMRLGGESQTAKFMDERLKKILIRIQDEEEIVEEINSVRGTNFTTIAEWFDDVQYNLVHARDVMFNEEFATEVVIPAAPFVSLDYDLLQTHQSFGEEYEYCFADGVWKPCEGTPISFEVGVVPGTLRVRVKATETTMAGYIETVKIYAQRELSKLIDVKYDGAKYLVDNLSADYYYQIFFTNDPEAAVNWDYAKIVAGSTDTVTVRGYGKYDYAIIRSCLNADKNETSSVPLVVAVDKKHSLNLVIEGSGTVSQSSSVGRYYYGDTIDLMAQPMTGNTFEGWYIDGVCVSQDTFYVLEMVPDVQITATFTGAKIESVTIAQLPYKLQYVQGEELDLTGIELQVTYSDGSTVSAKPDAAYLKSNQIGKTQVVVGFGGVTAEYDVEILMNPGASMPTVELDFAAAALVLQNDLAVRLKVDGDLFAQAGFENPYVVCRMNGSDYTIYNFAMVDGNCVFDFAGINPSKINDSFTVTLYGEFNGRKYASEPIEYSVAQYCYNMLEKYSGDEHAEFRTMLVDMLNYGAASQQYVGYKTDTLANAGLTEQQKLWGTADAPALKDVQDIAYETIENPDVLWKGASVTLKDTVTLRFRLEAENIDGLSVKVVTESGKELVITADQFTEARNGTYYAECDALVAAQMSETVYATVYRDQEIVSDTLRYSIESYAYSKQNDANEALSALIIAMMKYCNAAKAYGT